MKDGISVVGLGRLGLPLATCFAERGFDMIGVDIDSDLVSSINAGVSPIVEPGLEELISRLGGKKLRATTNHSEAIEQTDITFILVSTPSEPDGGFSNRYVEAALRSLGEALAQSEKPNHIFVVSSTVIPGSTGRSFIPLLEECSRRKLNSGFNVCYNPDFVALGKVLSDFWNPDFVLVGQSEAAAGERVASVYRRMCKNDAEILRTSIINAEIIKVSLNAYITMKIGFANTVAQICEKTPGTDADVVTATLGRDKRISPSYFRGGLSYGGTCFPRDTSAFVRYCELCGADGKLVEASEEVNRGHNRHLCEFVLDHVSPEVADRTVSILGLAFKPDTPVIVESPAIQLIDELLKNDVGVTVYDRFAMENVRELFGVRISYAGTAEECIRKSSVCVVTTPDDEFSRIDTSCIDRPVRIIDCWRILDKDHLGDNVKYVPMGRGQDIEECVSTNV